MKDVLISLFCIAVFLVFLYTVRQDYNGQDENKTIFPKPDLMAQCKSFTDNTLVRCIGERVKFRNDEIMVYRCSDGYIKATSLFTHICEDRRLYEMENNQ